MPYDCHNEVNFHILIKISVNCSILFSSGAGFLESQFLNEISQQIECLTGDVGEGLYPPN